MTVRETDAAVVTDTEAHRAVTVVTVAVTHHTAAVETSMEILRAAAARMSAKAHRAAAIETHAVIRPAAASGTNAEARSTARKRMYIKNADKTVKERSGLSIAALFFNGISVFSERDAAGHEKELAFKVADFPEAELAFPEAELTFPEVQHTFS